MAALGSACRQEDPTHHIEELRLINIKPTTGMSGEVAVIQGTNFGAEISQNRVTINGVEARILNASSGELRIILPENAPGAYPVKVEVGDRQIEGLKFTYLKASSRTFLVSTIVGMTGNKSTVDGIGTSATTWFPTGLAYAPDGSIWFTERGNRAIRRLSPGMSVETLVSSTELDNPWHGGFDADGNYYVVSKANGRVIRITPDLKLTTFASGINNPMACLCDEAGNVYVASRDHQKIIRYTPDGAASDFILFDELKPNCMCRDAAGNFFVGGTDFGRIMMVTPQGEQRIIAGDGDPGSGIDDGEPGNPLTAHIGNIFALGLDANGVLYMADCTYHTIRMLTPDASGDYTKGTLETIAGTGSADCLDGEGLKAAFNNPYGILPSADGKTIYVADATNCLLRMITVK